MTPLSVDGRAARLRQQFSEIDALIVSNLVNVRWLTGFTGSNGWAVLTRDGVTLVTDGRYGDQAESQLAAAGCQGEVLVGRTGAQMQQLLLGHAARHGRVGFESTDVTVADHAAWTTALAGAATLVPTRGIVESARRVKDPAEIERIQRACAIADEALAVVAGNLVPGRSEADVRNQLESVMRDLGADGPSYETIVATGPINAARPHHRPTPTTLHDGHTLIIDVGALVDGYHSDMTRSYVIGEATAQQNELYELVLAAQLAGVAAVGPGVPTVDVDAACRSIITDAGYGEWFTHGTGHGVGLLIHEDPYSSIAGGYTLQVGDVVTVEPGVYREGFGGFRVEDLVTVTSTGGHVLTSSPKDSPCPPSPPTI